MLVQIQPGTIFLILPTEIHSLAFQRLSAKSYNLNYSMLFNTTLRPRIKQVIWWYEGTIKDESGHAEFLLLNILCHTGDILNCSAY